MLGRNTNNGTNAGVTYWNANNDSTNDNINIGSRLSLYDLKDIKTMPLGKT